MKIIIPMLAISGRFLRLRRRDLRFSLELFARRGERHHPLKKKFGVPVGIGGELSVFAVQKPI